VNAIERPRRNAAESRLRILSAAQKAFSERGYAQTGIRDIAALANVSSALVLRYFGSKLGAFEAALIASMQLEPVLAAGKAAFGRHLATTFLREDLDVKPPVLIAILTGDPAAREVTARVTETHLIAPLADWLGPPDGRARAMEISMLATGFVIYMRQLPLTPSEATKAHVTEWLAASIQAIVDQSAA
jgi:AcrR family transcriptional regulator